MGTRNLTMVISQEKTKVAQYGQWDGYPDGQGLTVLEFLKTADLKLFKEKVDKLSFYTKEEIDELNKLKNPFDEYPYLSRDVAAEILNEIMNKDISKLVNSEDFVKDSLFCEWGYVIDLDKQTFEVYSGFVKSSTDKTERFYSETPNDGGYYPIKLERSFSLSNLPTEEEFLDAFKEEESEE